MTRRNVFLTLGAAALALAIAVPAAFSRGPGPRGDKEGWRGDRIERLAGKLGLDDKQKAALTTLKEDHRDEAQSIREQVRAKREATRALWLAPNPDKQAILAAEREINALEGQLAESRVEFMFAARGVLTPEQFGEFVELQKKRGFGKHHRGGKRGFGKGFGPGPAPGSPDTTE